MEPLQQNSAGIFRRIKKGHVFRVPFCAIPVLLYAHLVEGSFNILLELAEGLGAFDQLGLCLTVHNITQHKARSAIDTGLCPGVKILLHTVLEFAAVVTAIELVDVQAVNFFGDLLDPLVGEGAHILTFDVGEQQGMHLPELVLVAGALGSCRRILRFG